MNIARLNVYWILTIIFFGMILFGTLSPSDVIDPPNLVSDKHYHFLAFTILVMPLVLNKLKNAYWILPLAISLGAIIEFVQPKIGRHGDINDFYADALGAVLGVILAAIIKLKRLF